MIEQIYLIIDKNGQVYPTVFKRLRDAKSRRTNMNNQGWGKRRGYYIAEVDLSSDWRTVVDVDEGL